MDEREEDQDERDPHELVQHALAAAERGENDHGDHRKLVGPSCRGMPAAKICILKNGSKVGNSSTAAGELYLLFEKISEFDHILGDGLQHQP